jgi:hypothetical protein
MLENPQGFQPEAQEGRTRRTQTPKTKTPALKKAQENREGNMAATGRILPAAPMSADELAAAWSVAADDAETITVKVLRYQLGTKDLELVASMPLVSFDGEHLAGKYGPGTYYLRPAAGPYAKHAAKLTLSEALARNAGYGRIQPTAQDFQAERTLRKAVEGPTDPVDLLAAIEQVMDRREAEKARQFGQVPQTFAPPDPFAAMKQQFENMQSMMAFMGGLEERAIKTVEMRMGKTDSIISAEDTNTSLLEKLLPKALDIFGQMMSNRQPAPALNQPQPGQHQTQHQAQQYTEPPKVINPPEPEVPPMPNLTPQEQNAIGGAVAMLRPHGSTLVELAASGMNDDQIVSQLDPWIPSPLVPELAQLAAVVAQHGPAVLAAIHPGLAVDRWASILPKLVAALQAGE